MKHACPIRQSPEGIIRYGGFESKQCLDLRIGGRQLGNEQRRKEEEKEKKMEGFDMSWSSHDPEAMSESATLPHVWRGATSAANVPHDRFRCGHSLSRRRIGRISRSGCILVGGDDEGSRPVSFLVLGLVRLVKACARDKLTAAGL
ncbi:hypothetical protein HPP92_009250 [Vanilla planifolia]|uniref:Uncharacterized protein n=1 Tax=Vanilla planifolia TaxID=51239 RepID=A0A835RFH9_VANPL|nr:hypothetical protein HPP92_009250 [Vanilla planifolia]